jgi:acyl-coenzyme A thioesterase PaaI-like protein
MESNIYPHGVSVKVCPVAPGRSVSRRHPLKTASLRVNFIRQFRGGPEQRYSGTALRVGRRSGIGEIQAIGPGREVAIVARLTAYC